RHDTSPHSFPTRRSSDLSLPKPIHGLADQLVRGRPELHPALAIRQLTEVWHHIGVECTLLHGVVHPPVAPHAGHVMVGHMAVEQDRKSTRLNSSHVSISY